MSKKVSFPQWMLLLVVMLFSVAAFAQTTASIKGTVTDQTGATVVGAKVIVKDAALGIERTTQTNAGTLALINPELVDNEHLTFSKQ